jgi:hypothetical protein
MDTPCWKNILIVSGSDYLKQKLIIYFLLLVFARITFAKNQNSKSRVVITSDGEIDDECSMVRFLLFANEWDIGIMVKTQVIDLDP